MRCYPAEQATKLPDLPEFSPATVTEDARNRRRMYQAGFQRDAARAELRRRGRGIPALAGLVMRIGRASGEDLTRVEELTLRTSQMNATGVHYSDADAALRCWPIPATRCWSPRSTDRFGPHGAVGVVLLEKHPAVWHLKLLATSCRVVAFGAGAVLLRWLTDQAARRGCAPGRRFPQDRPQPDDGGRLPVRRLHHEPCACRDRA